MGAKKKKKKNSQKYFTQKKIDKNDKPRENNLDSNLTADIAEPFIKSNKQKEKKIRTIYNFVF